VGEPYPAAWPGHDGEAELTRIEAGRGVKAPAVLFRKLEDQQIAEWKVQFGGVA
jgi:methionyl-tRNA synthetase